MTSRFSTMSHPQFASLSAEEKSSMTKEDIADFLNHDGCASMEEHAKWDDARTKNKFACSYDEMCAMFGKSGVDSIIHSVRVEKEFEELLSK